MSCSSERDRRISSCALHLTNLINAHNERAKESGAKPLDEINIAVIEKAAEIGAHQLSGAVLDPSSLRELIPDFEKHGQAPLEAPVGEEKVYFLTERGKMPMPDPPAAAQKSRQLRRVVEQACALAGREGRSGRRQHFSGISRRGDALRRKIA